MDAPAVAVNRDVLKLGVAWMDMRSGRNDRQVYWSAMDGLRDKPLAGDAKGIKGHPSISFDEKGVLHAAWEDDRSGVQRIRYRTLPGDGMDVALSPEKGKASFPSLACGKVVGVAYEYRSDAVFVPVNE
jgi:hypothetical protein